MLMTSMVITREKATKSTDDDDDGDDDDDDDEPAGREKATRGKARPD